MATNRSIFGLSGRGFRVPDSTGAWTTVKENVVKVVDVDDRTTQLILSREKYNFARVRDAGTATISNANPAVVTKNGHGLVADDVVVFTTSGALPTGLVAGKPYYVLSANLTANTFKVSLTSGGTAVATSSAGSGTHTLTQVSTTILGLDRLGFRVKQTDGTIETVKVGSGVHRVNLASGDVRRSLKRNKARWIVSASDSQVSIRGIRNTQLGFYVPDNTSLTITSNNSNVTNNKKVTVGDVEYTFKTNLTQTYATATLTSDNTNVTDGDTVTIDDVVYTFADSPSGAGSIQIGANADESLDNLADYINDDETATVSAGEVTSHAVVFTARQIGTAGNAITKSETSSHLSWNAGATFTGGVDPVANEVKIGGSADASLGSLAAAINGEDGEGTVSLGTVANADVTASSVVDHVVTLTAVQGGDAIVNITTDEATLTVNTGQLTDGISTIHRRRTASVNPSDSKVYQQLRRYFKGWVEV